MVLLPREFQMGSRSGVGLLKQITVGSGGIVLPERELQIPLTPYNEENEEVKFMPHDG